VRPARLAEPHLERHLAALEPGAHHVRARAGLLALDPAAGVPALAGAEPAPDALAVLPRLRGLQVRKGKLLLGCLFGGHRTPYASSTLTRCATFLSIPASCGLSVCSTLWPILRRPSARSVPRCRSDWPILLCVWVILTLLMPRAPRQQRPAREPPSPRW